MASESAQRLLAAGLGLFAAGLRLLLGPLPIDDAFITFRYAENLRQGLGFVYNPDERLLGTSTPLFTLLIAAARSATGLDPTTIALGTSAISDAISVALLCWLAVRVTGDWLVGGLAGLYWAVAPASVVYARSGMETSFFVLLLLASCCLLVSGRPVWASATAAVATLVRPDGLIMVGLIGLAALWRHRDRVVACGVVVAAILLPWLAFSWSYFGTLIPHSALVKAAGGGYTLAVFTRILVDLPVTFLMGGATRQLFGPLATPIVAVVLGALAVCVARALWDGARRGQTWLAAIAYPAVYVAGMLARGVFAFPWYLVPPLPLLFLGALVGARRFGRPIALALGCVLLAINLGAYATDGNFAQIERRERERMDLYTEASAVVRQCLTGRAGSARVAVPEVGIIGYQLRPAEMIDFGGLVTDLRPFEREQRAPLEATRPEYLVGLAVHVDPLLAQPSSAQLYQRVWSRVGADGREALVLARQDVVATCAG